MHVVSQQNLGEGQNGDKGRMKTLCGVVSKRVRKRAEWNWTVFPRLHSRDYQNVEID